MFINFSNHPSTFWSEHQKVEASRFGEIVDVQFPLVPPNASEKVIEELANEFTERITRISSTVSPEEVTIHAMGEMTLCFRIVNKLKQEGYTCVASTTRRVSREQPNGEKTSLFTFVRFRQY